MMKFYAIIFIVALFVGISGQSSFSDEIDCSEKINVMRWLDKANPEIDAKRRIDAGDTKFKAIMDYSLSIPGVASTVYFRASNDKNYTVIEGTGDNYCNEEHARLNKKAYEYASKYNLYLIENMNK